MLFLKCLCRRQEIVCLDVNALVAEFDGDEEFVASLVKTGLGDFAKDVTSMKSALKSRDREEICDAAHTIKGSSSNLRCTPLALASTDLEVHARSFDWSIVEQKAKLVLNEVDKVNKAAGSYLSRRQP